MIWNKYNIGRNLVGIIIGNSLSIIIIRMLTNIIIAIVTDIEILFYSDVNSISVTILTTIFNMIAYIDIIGKNFGQLIPEK